MFSIHPALDPMVNKPVSALPLKCNRKKLVWLKQTKHGSNKQLF